MRTKEFKKTLAKALEVKEQDLVRHLLGVLVWITGGVMLLLGFCGIEGAQTGGDLLRCLSSGIGGATLVYLECHTPFRQRYLREREAERRTRLDQALRDNAKRHNAH